MLGSSFRRFSLALAVALAFSAKARGSDFFVSPSGSADGDGNFGNPWSLAFALSQPAAVKPGDTIWLRAGTYEGTFTSELVGTADAPVVVRQYPGERATLDGGQAKVAAVLTVGGAYSWYWGFELMSSSLDRTSAQISNNPSDVDRPYEGINVDQSSTHPGLKFINLIIHDLGQGFGYWVQATDSEISGCLIYYNGWIAPDGGHGHGIYVQNSTGTKLITDNIIFSNFNHGVHAFGTGGASLDNIDIEGNTIFDNGRPDNYQRNVLVGGGSVAQSPRIVNNVLYYPGTSGQNLNVGYDPYGAGAANPVITGNYVVNGDNQFSPLNTNVTMTGNTFYSTIPVSIQTLFPLNEYLPERPTAAQVFVRPNRYEPGRAHVTVFNWSNAASVSVDLSSIVPVGAVYEIRNAKDYFRGPFATGTSRGSAVELPTTSLPVPSPMGLDVPPPDSDFQVFVVRWRAPTHVDRPPVQPVSTSPRSHPHRTVS
ncbi:MAG TPA: right-handed parallel beta-helix repeat-containing protein [Thermoanaerobaculia bacterium]|nr:right-handed parallel beta-helix repeat-containing protein [Thermoanaerobaculia bacterium]